MYVCLLLASVESSFAAIQYRLKLSISGEQLSTDAELQKRRRKKTFSTIFSSAVVSSSGGGEEKKRKFLSIVCVCLLREGLLDFSQSKHTKTEKCDKLPQTVTNCHKIDQMDAKYSKGS
jgi:hypothetical protein